ncbi:4-hydroxythreonine-4-phosphate dehydrogenase PdxA [Hirschia maritima]|uniref:4-hydroxythreonine-4-phosphate dehydrogenase PdxA n=1 Tax=Hirschia maritima TaxID=1121961 RepID=UPI0003A59816|nr:4-hydroxythreonine-4-phosphate dehydrogenase PdxA [Hirschia maritima]
MNKDLPLAVTMGDPAGVGPILTWRAWQALKHKGQPFFTIANADILKKAQLVSGVTGAVEIINSPAEAIDVCANALPVLNIDCPPTIIGHPNENAASAIVESIQQAVTLVFDGQASGVVTNPINKALLYKQGFQFPGHTEFLADLARKHTASDTVPRPIMMLVGGDLKVALATIHEPIRKVPDLITKELIKEVVNIVYVDLINKFGTSNPRIALAGLNPHAGEDGSLGQEEIEQINPAAESLRQTGINVSDAQPGDTVFHSMLEGQFDAVIAMYHDQGLAPLKSLDMWGGVNVTLGLPFIRTSPDHGTGYAVAADGSARADSLIAAINLAADMAKTRASA